MTTQYIATQPIQHNGVSYAVDDAVFATAEDAKFLLLAGYIKDADPQRTPKRMVKEEKEPKYDTWVKADLNAELDKREIEHDATATNAVLAALLVADDALNAED